jgi:uncharacterized membrane protein
MVKRKEHTSPLRLIVSLIVLAFVPVFLIFARVVESDSSRYLFLIWNLTLAAIPLLLSLWLVKGVQKNGWLKPKELILTAMWLLFLPNSFYIVTDFIHLRETFEVSLLFDGLMILAFVLSGLAMGFVSVYLVHRQLLSRISSRRAWGIIMAVFVVSSFAIYLGRFSRWNTWDILLAPAGLLFDVSDRVINPAAHVQTYIITFVVFLILTSVYWVIWEAARYLRD